MSAGFIKAARRFSTTIGAGGVADASVTTIPMTLIPPVFQDGDYIEIVIDRVSITGELTPDLEEVTVGVVSGTNIVSAERGVEGTAQAHSAGAVVEIKLQADMWNRMIQAMLQEHNQDGTHDDTVVTLNDATQTLTNKTFGDNIDMSGNVFENLGGFSETVVPLDDGANVELDASLGNIFALSAGGNRTINPPTNPTDGQKIIIIHHASGAIRTLTLSTSTGGFLFGSTVEDLDGATESGKRDLIGCVYNEALNKWLVVAVVKGF